MQDPACRLLTLAGPGGVGKTRLALEAARQMRAAAATDAFAPGPYFISLVGTSATEFIVPAVGEAIGFTFSGAAGLKEQLFHFLKEKTLLLILDNLEHLLDGIELLEELLAYAPGVKILTTSREPLNLSAEWVFEVQGLPVPTSTKDLNENSAAALFLQRARQVNVNFTPTLEDLPAVARICQLVEGLPLALELAASWVRVASLSEVAGEIENSLEFLTTAARDLPQRHRSMRAVFDQSWSLLTEEERRVVQRLSVFRAGFTREAAMQVAGANLPLISALVDSSFVRRGGPGRYDLHELTRQYAAARLQENTAEALFARTRHAEYFLTLLGGSESQLRGTAQVERLGELKPEIENIRAAWDEAAAREMFHLLRSASGGLYYFFELHQFFHEAESRFGRAARSIQARLAAPERFSTSENARLLGTLSAMEGRQAFFLQRLGRNTEALALYRQALERSRSLDEPFLTAYALIFLGIVTWSVGSYEQAARSFEEGIPLARGVVSARRETAWLLVVGLCFQGALEHDQGRYEQAYERLHESMTLCRQTGDPYITLLVGTLFSRTAQARGLLGQAQDLLQESLRFARETNNRWGIGLGLEQLAAIAHQTGDEITAREMLEESVAMHREVGDSWSLSRALHALSQVALAQKDLSTAGRCALEAFRVAAREDYSPNALDALAAFAAVQAQSGRHSQVLEIALLVLRHPASPQQARDLAESLRKASEARLNAEEIMEIEDRAAGQSLEEAIARVSEGYSG